MRTAGLVMGLWLALIVPAVSAHVTEKADGLAVTLHMEPGDNPIIGEPANLFLNARDRSLKFNPENCNCNLLVTGGSRTLLQSALTPAEARSSYTFKVPIVFPEKGVYKIDFYGEPKIPGAFEKFAVTFDLRVDREAGELAYNHHFHHLLPAIGILAYILIYMLFFNKRKTHA